MLSRVHAQTLARSVPASTDCLQPRCYQYAVPLMPKPRLFCNWDQPCLPYHNCASMRTASP